MRPIHVLIVSMTLTASVHAALATAARTAGAHYVDPNRRYALTIPHGCSAPAAHEDRFVITCVRGAASIGFTAGGTDQPALQQIVNRLIAGWQNLRLIKNDRRSTLDGRSARTLFAVGTQPDGRVANIQIVAVAKDGGWYALTFTSPDWQTDSTRYFATIAASFRFVKPVMK